MKPTKAKTFKLSVSDKSFTRWEMLKTFSSGSTSIITEVLHAKNSTTLTVKPYKRPKNKWLAMLKFWWLRICVHYS